MMKKDLNEFTEVVTNEASIITNAAVEGELSLHRYSQIVSIPEFSVRNVFSHAKKLQCRNLA